MDNGNDPGASPKPPTQEISPESPVQPQEISQADNPSGRSKFLVSFLRFLVIGGGLFIVLVIGLGISFSACFTIKGPPPPQCGPVSFVSLILMPGASLFFLVPLAKKIK